MSAAVAAFRSSGVTASAINGIPTTVCSSSIASAAAVTATSASANPTAVGSPACCTCCTTARSSPSARLTMKV